MVVMDESVLLLDVLQVADMFGLNKSTVFKLVSCGKFPKPVKIGRATRWLKNELTAWLTAKCPPLGKWETMKAMSNPKIK